LVPYYNNEPSSIHFSIANINENIKIYIKWKNEFVEQNLNFYGIKKKPLQFIVSGLLLWAAKKKFQIKGIESGMIKNLKLKCSPQNTIKGD